MDSESSLLLRMFPCFKGLDRALEKLEKKSFTIVFTIDSVDSKTLNLVF